MSELIYVTAQPDIPYFHWQCEVYAHNFEQKGIHPNQIHMIFALVGEEKKPSEFLSYLKTKGYNVYYYNDEREKTIYIPSIKPYLIYKWLEEHPKFGKLFFLHDSDIIFRELPNYEKYLNDNICYLADTKGYVGYNYIIDCCRRYESQYTTTWENQLIDEMVDVVGTNVECLRCNQENSGGGQYIIKNTTPEMWLKIYKDSTALYDQMLNYQSRFPINPGEIQFWTAEMWALLWNLWWFEKETRIINDLDFSWATDNLDTYYKKPILHMAGVTDNLKSTKFYKGDYISVNPLDKLKENPNFFDYIDKDSATINYIEVMKSLIKKQ
jgi:hypothetical protein